MPIPSDLDHLVYAVPDLAAGVAAMTALLGVAPSPGGPHPGLGTRNFLVSLGESCYLEIIGPDPEQPQPSRPRPFGLDRLAGGRLVSWAIHDARPRSARRRGASEGLRRRSDPAAQSPVAGGSDRVATDSARRAGRRWPGAVRHRLGQDAEPGAELDAGLHAARAARRASRSRCRRRRCSERSGRSSSTRRRAALVARIATPRGEVELR